MRQLGGLGGRSVHRFCQCYGRVCGFLKDLTSRHHVIAVEAYDERLISLLTTVFENAQGLDDAGGHLIARGNATEHVYEYGLHLRVAQDNFKPGSHHIGRCTATDVEEVRGLDATVVFTGISNDIKRRHYEPRAVTDYAHVAVELDVIQALFFGLGFQRVRGGLVGEISVMFLAEDGVLIEGDLAIEGNDLSVFGAYQRVDLNQGRVFAEVDVGEFLQYRNDLLGYIRSESGLLDDLTRFGLVDAGVRIDRNFGERLGALNSQLFDVHAALNAGHRQVGAVRTVQQEREVVLFCDLVALSDHHGVDRVALDVHPQDLAGLFTGLLRGVCQLNAAGFAAAANLYLCLYNNCPSPELLSGCNSLFGCAGEDSAQHRDFVALKHVTRLIFEQVHPAPPFRMSRWHDRLWPSSSAIVAGE